MLDEAKRYFHKIQLKNKQRCIDKQFDGELSDEILDQQLEVNKKRNKLDIPDESQFVYKEYVQ